MLVKILVKNSKISLLRILEMERKIFNTNVNVISFICNY